MSNTVVGIFEYESDAQEAQNYLLANGFADGDVDIKTASYKSETDTAPVKDDNDDVMDRIGNFFKDLFDGDEEETKRYSEAGKRGTIVTVHAATAAEAEAAAAILDEYGAVDVNESAANYSSNQGYSGTVTGSSVDSYVENTSDTYEDKTLDNYGEKTLDTYEDKTSDTYGDKSLGTYEDKNLETVTDRSFVSDDSDDDSRSLPVIEEELQVGKQEVETGGVRLRSRIIERPVQESIRLRQEQVTVNRTPVDRAASDSDFATFKEGTIEMKEYAEVPVVSKEARIIEEVSLNKTVDERDEIINETVRNTEVEVEDLTDEERVRRTGLDL
ncbi:YsnF/AvaK domain-containing protein [Dyadobacter arcticus]|uniref:Uncharacterized protein (TIGR02271 family) n=1 Tax=Dyadobacter arcticus TaxID=1078754 RepID=A0ABX0UGI0_9BACT|nr:YsnF/AvaK domain-containing protein [Dyadobacter arcticus]NIJ52118.1 uncharacterized protein (TIGR02271 family) [Dyadobacter arcticus]